MPTIPDSLSRKFANMSFLCACLVVLIHIFPRFEPGCWRWWVHALLARGLTRVAVPYFFLAAGFFLAGHIGEPAWWPRELRKRVRTLLVPCYLTLLLWTALEVALVLLLPPTSNLPLQARLAQNIHWVRDLGLHPFVEPTLYALWFLRTLFLFVLLSPLLARPLTASRKSGLRLLAALFLLHLLLVPYPRAIHLLAQFLSQWPRFATFPFARLSAYGSYLLTYTFSLSGLFYFALGIFLRHHAPARPLSARQTLLATTLGLGLLVLHLLGRLHQQPLGIYFSILSLPPLLAALWRLMPERACIPPSLLSGTFAIYLLHLPFLKLLSWTSRLGLLPLPPQDSLLGYATRALLAIAGSLATARALKRLCPTLANLWLGGR